MLIREATIKDYNQINELSLRHNLNLPDEQEWTRLWLKNPEFNFDKNSIGWVLEDDKKIKGFLGFIKKKYYDDTDFQFNSLICHNWVVDKDYRSLSLGLLNKFFSQKNYDLFINSTASPEVSKVWEAFGAKKIPLNNIQSSLIVPINYKKVSNKIFKNNILKFFLNNFFKYFIKFKILSHKENLKYRVDFIENYDEQIENFDNSFRDKNFIQEKINYDWYISILNKKSKINFLKILKNENIIAYCVLLSSKNTNLKKTYLAQIKIKEDYLKDKNLYKLILKKIFIYSKNIDSDLIEIKYIDESIFKILKKIIIFNRNRKFCSFYYYSKDKNLISKLSKKKWLVSMFSGDSFLV